MNIKYEIGTKVIGNWGAMHPTSEGEIVGVEIVGVEILWDGETEVDYVHKTSIHKRPENGLPIGIFLKEDAVAPDTGFRWNEGRF